MSKAGLKVFPSMCRAPFGQLLAAGQYGLWSQSAGSNFIGMLSATVKALADIMFVHEIYTTVRPDPTAACH